jgi:hypothetical protein
MLISNHYNNKPDNSFFETKIIRLTGIVVFAFSIIFLFGYIIVTVKGFNYIIDELFWLIKEGLGHFMAALMATGISLYFLKSYYQRKREDQEKNLLGTIKASVDEHLEKFKPKENCPIDLCTQEDMCPPGLRKIRKDITNFTEAPLFIRGYNFLHSILNERLELIHRQTINLKKGEWTLSAPDDFDLESPTEADLMYHLISREVLKKGENIEIIASTIFKYIPWWLTNKGLFYLEKQRTLNVERVFLFPNKVMNELFPGFDCKYAKVEKLNAGSSTFVAERLKWIYQTHIVFALHYLLNINIFVLTPYMIENKGLRDSVLRDYIYKDIGLLHRGIDGDINNICSIEYTIKKEIETPEDILNPEKGLIIFDNDKVNKTKEILITLKNCAMSYESALSSNCREFINKRINKLSDVLGYAVADRNIQENRASLLTLRENINEIAYPKGDRDGPSQKFHPVVEPSSQAGET